MTDEFMPPPDSAITPEEWQQTPARVQRWIRAVWSENQQLRDTVERVREIAQRNSQNSSQPPSQDRPDQKPTRERQDRQRGTTRYQAIIEHWGKADEVIVLHWSCEQWGNS
jgi:hypothetical protein